MYIHTGTYLFVYIQKKVWKMAHQTANWVTSTEVVLGGGFSFILLRCFNFYKCKHVVTTKINWCVALRILYLRMATGSHSIFLLHHPSTCTGLTSNCSLPPGKHLWAHASLSSCPAC